MQIIKRRRFLMAAGGFGACALIGGEVGRRVLTSDGQSPDGVESTGSENRSRYESFALGSNISLTVVHPRRDVREAAIKAAFAAIERVEAAMSIYRDGSELSRLNANQQLQDPDPWLVEVLQYAQSLSRRTNGAFDITVQPLWDLFQQSKTQQRLPTDAEIAAAKRQVNWRRLQFNSEGVQLLENPAGAGRITLNGIAQGFACDKAWAALREHGVEHALLDTGELAGYGVNEENRQWNVGIQHPRVADSYVAVTRLQGRSLATSGDYATTFSDDKTHHHLFDPRTGRSPTDLASVSVAAPTGMQADALSTAIFVLGPRQGLQLASDLAGVDVLLVRRNGEIVSTSGFPA